MASELKPSEWRYEIQYGPEGEANYAWVFVGKEMVCTAKTHHAMQMVEAMNRRREPVAELATTITIRNDEAGFFEFVNSDVPYIVREIDGPSAVLLDMETRQIIGYRVYDAVPTRRIRSALKPAGERP